MYVKAPREGLAPVTLDRQYDHSEWQLKLTLRRALLRAIPNPPHILETHGGKGLLWQAVYQHASGVVLERDKALCRHLERQRGRGWAVVAGTSERLLAQGFAAGVLFDLVDCDPHKQPWPVLTALFTSKRVWGATLGVVVTDSLRQPIRYSGGKRIPGMEPYEARYGKACHTHYLEVAQERLTELAGRVGFRLVWWDGAYGGGIHTMTYYAARFVRSGL